MNMCRTCVCVTEIYSEIVCVYVCVPTYLYRIWKEVSEICSCVSVCERIYVCEWVHAWRLGFRGVYSVHEYPVCERVFVCVCVRVCVCVSVCDLSEIWIYH